MENSLMHVHTMFLYKYQRIKGKKTINVKQRLYAYKKGMQLRFVYNTTLSSFWDYKTCISFIYQTSIGWYYRSWYITFLSWIQKEISILDNILIYDAKRVFEYKLGK